MSLRSLMIPAILTMVATTASSATKWTKIESNGGRVNMPGTPKEQSVKQQVNGIHFEIKMYTTFERTAMYLFSTIHYPISSHYFSNAETIVRKSQNNVLRKRNGELRSSKTIRVGRHSGREIRFVAKTGKVTLYCVHRAVLVGNKLYQQMVISPFGFPKTKDVQSFFDSLKIGETPRRRFI